MIALLANISDASPQGIKDVIIVLGALVGLAGGIFALLRKPQVFPQPMETKKAADYVPRHEFLELKTEVHAMRGMMTNMKDALMEAGERRAISIHGRIEPLSECVHELSGELKQLAVQFHNLNNRLSAGNRKL